MKRFIEFEKSRHIGLHAYDKVDGCPWLHGCPRVHEGAIMTLSAGGMTAAEAKSMSKEVDVQSSVAPTYVYSSGVSK